MSNNTTILNNIPDDIFSAIPLTTATHTQYGSKTGILSNLSNSSPSLSSVSSLPAENDTGSIEYKYKLVGKSSDRITSLTTQMNYRLQEGGGECCYEIGILDNGYAAGLNDQEFKESIETIQFMAKQLNCETEILRVANGNKGKVAEILVRKKLKCSATEGLLCNIRIALIGCINCGKSTLLGCLTNNEYDNGKGAARRNIFQHRHELEAGMTSSIAKEIVGFDSSGNITNTQSLAQSEYNYSLNSNNTWRSIIERSSKLITFYDSCGSELYMKTTIQGLIGSAIDYAIITVAANIGINKTTKEHLVLSLALNIPIIILITKIDLVNEEELNTVQGSIMKVLQSPACNKQPIKINTRDELQTTISDIINQLDNTNTTNTNNNNSNNHSKIKQITAILSVSSVSGLGFDLLKEFLYLLPRPNRMDWNLLNQKPTQFMVDSIYNIDSVGLIVAGTVSAGKIHIGDILLLGPITTNKTISSANSIAQFIPIKLLSIHSNRCPVSSCNSGETASIHFEPVNSNILITKEMLRRGQVLLDSQLKPFPRACTGFEASIQVLNLSPNTLIQSNYTPVCHINTIAQSAKILNSTPKQISCGEFAQVRFEFCYSPEYIQLKQKLILREGSIKGVGIINKLYYENEIEEKLISNNDDNSISINTKRKSPKQQANNNHNNNTSNSADTTPPHTTPNNHNHHNSHIPHSQSDQTLSNSLHHNNTNGNSSNGDSPNHLSADSTDYPIVCTPLTRSISQTSDNSNTNTSQFSNEQIEEFHLNNPNSNNTAS